MPFTQAPAGARRILGGWQRSGWLWCCGRSCWWCSQHMTKLSSPAGSDQGRRGLVRGYKVVALLLKPSLGLFGLLGRHRVLLPHPGSVTGHLIVPGDHHTLQHTQVHFKADFVAGNFIFITLGTSLLFAAIQICILRVLAMVLLSSLESVESMSYTAAHFRSRSLNIASLSDRIEGSSRYLDLYITGQLVDSLEQKKKKKKKKKKKRKPVFIKRKWNHVVFSRATILTCWIATSKWSSSNFSCALTFTSGLILLGKVWAPLFPQL